MPKDKKLPRGHYRLRHNGNDWEVGYYNEESINGFIGWNCYSTWPTYAQALIALDTIIREEFGTTIAEEEARKEREETNKELTTSQPRGKELTIRRNK